MSSDAIDMPRSSAPPRFTPFNRTFPRKDRSSGTLPNDLLFGRNRIFFACVVDMQSPCDMDAHDVRRHIVTTSTPTLVGTQDGFETRMLNWTLERPACRFREHPAHSPASSGVRNRVEATIVPKMTLACDASPSRTAKLKRDTRTRASTRRFRSRHRARDRSRPPSLVAR